MPIEVAEVRGPDDPRLDVLLEVRRAVDAWLDPGDPVIPRAELAAELFVLHRDIVRRAWLATLDGKPAGLAVAERELDGINDATVGLDVFVDPAHARRGVARALVAEAVRASADEGCTSLVGAAIGAPGIALCRALGMTHRQDGRVSRLHIADVDEAQQARWIDEAPGRALGYRVVTWTGPAPDARVEHLCRALDAMTDAPLDDLDWTIPPLTVDRLSDREAAWVRRGFDIATALALAPGGEAAGATQLLVSRHRPALGHQSDTGVVAQHRGHGLGRWLKAANLRQVLERQPALAVVDTDNAESNPYMLAINVDMGYRPYRTLSIHQAPMSTALRALDLHP